MHGKVWTTRNVVVERLDVAAGTRLRKHEHDVPQLALLEWGRIHGRFGHRDRQVDAGTLRMSPSGDVIDLTFAEPSRCIVVQLNGTSFDSGLPAIGERRFRRSDRIIALAYQLVSVLHSTQPSPLELESLVLELCADALLPPDHKRDPGRWLMQIRDRIRSDPANPPPTEELAAEAGYHPVYVARAFRRCFGIGLGEYTRLARADYALSLLATSEMGLAELALEAGYADQSHLTRSMRRFLGATPRGIRLGRSWPLLVSSVQESPLLRG